jgi:hypothetical protein
MASRAASSLVAGQRESPPRRRRHPSPSHCVHTVEELPPARRHCNVRPFPQPTISAASAEGGRLWGVYATSAQGTSSRPGSISSPSNSCSPSRRHRARPWKTRPNSRTRSTLSFESSASSHPGASACASGAGGRLGGRIRRFAKVPLARRGFTSVQERFELVPTGREVFFGELAQRGHHPLARPPLGAHRFAQGPILVEFAVEALAVFAQKHDRGFTAPRAFHDRLFFTTSAGHPPHTGRSKTYRPPGPCFGANLFVTAELGSSGRDRIRRRGACRRWRTWGIGGRGRSGRRRWWCCRGPGL